MLFSEIHIWSVALGVFMMNYTFQDGKSNYFQGIITCFDHKIDTTTNTVFVPIQTFVWVQQIHQKSVFCVLGSALVLAYLAFIMMYFFNPAPESLNC